MYLCEWLTDIRRWFILTSRVSRIYHRGCKPSNKHSGQTVGHPQKVGCHYNKSCVLCDSELLDVHIFPAAEIICMEFYLKKSLQYLQNRKFAATFSGYSLLVLLCSYAGVGRWSQIEEGTMECLFGPFFFGLWSSAVLGEDRVKIRRKGT